MFLTKDFKEFCELLNAHNVRYLVVGGHAVALHGYPRYTGDFDIWVSNQSENAQRVLVVLKEFGFGSLNITLSDLTDEKMVIQLGHEPNRIDLLMGISGVSFEEAWQNKLTTDYEGITLNFLSLSDLRKNKSATGRDEDKIDLKNLPEE
jgi:hypothetical protein